MKRQAAFVFIMVFLVIACAERKNSTQGTIINEPADEQRYIELSANDEMDIRIGYASEEIIKYLQSADGTSNYIPYRISRSEERVIFDYIHYLPKKFKELLNAKSTAIFFIKNLRYGGKVQYALEDDGSLFAILILNPELLHKSLRQWIEYRDNSPFLPGKLKVSNNLGDEYLGLLYALLHESAHIYDLFNKVTPYLDPGLLSRKGYSNHPTDFTRGIWLDYEKPEAQYDFANRANVKSYELNDKLPNEKIKDIYSAIISTCFSSIYGSKDWAEDFAELVTWYYIKHQFGIDYTIEVVENGTSLFSYSPMENELVGKRLKFIEDTLK